MALCNEPLHKKVKTEQNGDYPVDFIRSYRDLNDTKYETQLNGVREIPDSLHCWICGVQKKIQSSDVRDFDIFDDGHRSHQIYGLLCESEKPHFFGLKVAGRWWSTEEILSSKNTQRLAN